MGNNTETPILILGAGWIGAETARQLVEKGHHVTVVVQSRVTRILQNIRAEFPAKIEIIQADLRIPKQVNNILRKHGNGAHIFQFAARAFGSSHTNSTDPGDFEGNASINDNIIEGIRATEIQPASVNFSSSYFTYDAFGKPCPPGGYKESDLDPESITEAQLSDLKNINPYKWEKIRAEKRFRTLEEICRVNRFRFGNVTGCHQRLHPYNPHLVPILLDTWHKGGREKLHADIYGNDTTTRAWVDVSDIARGVLHVALDPVLTSDVWNIGGMASGAGHTTGEIVDALGKGLGAPVSKNILTDESGGQSIRLNTAKLRSREWEPSFTLAESMQRAAETYRQHGSNSDVSD